MLSPIYLDNQATTRCDPRVIEAMLPYFSEHYGNAASKSHTFGWMAEAAADLARERVAESIGAIASEMVFCSGATEANNLAILGVAKAYEARGKHIVVAATEHASVLDCAAALTKDGWRVTTLAVDSDGLVREEELIESLASDTTVVSLMLVNNEIGVIQNIESLAKAVHAFDPRIVVHCDAVQALGKIPVKVQLLGVDTLSVSAHKIYGPKGVGALWRRRRPRLALQPILYGGGHESGLRSGTIPVPLLVGFGVACNLAIEELTSERLRIGILAERFLKQLHEALPGVSLNGSAIARVPGNLNVSFEGIIADTLLSDVPGVAMSTGSACSSAFDRPSHVLAAIVSPERLKGSIRIGLGRFTTQEEMDRAASLLIAGVRSLRG